MPSHKTSDPLQARLLAFTQITVGCGLGLLIAGRFSGPARRITAAVLLLLGGGFAFPVALGAMLTRIGGPGSARGERRRLEVIRTDGGYAEDREIF